MDTASPWTSAPERIASSDGTPIAVWRTGAGPPLLLVHGTTADHTRWTRVAPGFAAGFTVYAMDRRGRGGSGDAERYSLEQEGEDVAAVADWIGEPVNLLGHSYGAICCLEAALRMSNLRRLALYEPPIPVGEVIARRETLQQLDELIARGERETAVIHFLREVAGVPVAQLEVMRAHPAWPARVAAAHTLSREASIEGQYRLDFDRLRSLDTPTLLLLGSDSPAFFHEATRRLAAALPEARVHEMAGQQHIAMDLIPEEFVEIVGAFLSS